MHLQVEEHETRHPGVEQIDQKDDVRVLIDGDMEEKEWNRVHYYDIAQAPVTSRRSKQRSSCTAGLISKSAVPNQPELSARDSDPDDELLRWHPDVWEEKQVEVAQEDEHE